MEISGADRLEIGGERESRHDPSSLERRWQERWHETRAFATPSARDTRPPAYVFADCLAASPQTDMEQLRSFTVADSCARFLRAHERAVLFSLVLDSFGAAAERESLRSGVPPAEWARRRFHELRDRLAKLGCSCDWERALASSEEACYRWTQRLFLALLEHELIYESGGRWFLRVDAYLEENERRLEGLTGWDTLAIDSQRAALNRVDGVELQAGTFGGGELTVFTPHAGAIAKATFVAVSPSHPQVKQWASGPAQAQQVAAMLRAMSSRHDRDAAGRADDAEKTPVVVTSALATVPGVPGIIPIVVSPLVDARVGPVAVLGIPELDPTDRAIAQRLPAPAGAAWRTSGSGAGGRPAVRYRVSDIPVSRPGPEGRRETDPIDSQLERLWVWLAPCVPPERRAEAMFTDPELRRWLPAALFVGRLEDSRLLFERRLFAQIAHDLGEPSNLPDGEPFSRALLLGTVRERGGTDGGEPTEALDVEELLARAGADAARLAMLSAASPAHALRWSEEPVGRCQRFLQALHAYARPRLGEWAQIAGRPPLQAQIDASERLRRRLALWCAAACERVTAELELLELQRATHDVMRLLTRIRDFEARASERRELDARDREAIVCALLVLVRLLAPLAPHIAEELWSLTGEGTRVDEAGWPDLARPGQAQRGGLERQAA